MSTLNHKAYAVRQEEIDYKTTDLVMMQAQLVNRDSKGNVMVEKVSKDAGTYSAGKYYIPGVPPLTNLYPLLTNASERACAFSTIFLA